MADGADYKPWPRRGKLNAMNVLSISSHVAYGHVGNAAAIFALQRLGIEAWPVHTVRYSNHPGHGRFRGTATGGSEVAELVAGLDEIGILAECDAVMSGYLGDAGTGKAVRDAVALVKRRNPNAPYLCDPVMGDVESGYFVPEGVRDEVRSAVTSANIVTPNAFELEALTGTAAKSLDDTLAAARHLHDLGPEIVIVTSLEWEPASIATVVSARTGAWMVTTPRIDLGRRADGAGDLLAALFLGHYLRDRDPASALAAAVSSVFGVLAAARAGGHRELPLVAAQSELVAPTRLFEADTVEG
jgi:pyridoxine kinase